MAGIVESKKLVEDKKNAGTVLYKGYFIDDYILFDFIIVKLDNDMGIIPQCDYGSDLHISNKIKVGDKVKLVIHDGYSSEWKKD